MPLHVLRLRDSEFTSEVSAEAFRAGVLLWCAAWHQVPAGSLPNNDKTLSTLAGYGRVVKEWEKVKDEALYGWVLCDDNRWYHPVVCEVAMESWVSKQEYNYKKFADRLRKRNAGLKEKQLPVVDIPLIEQWISAGMPSDWGNDSESPPREGKNNSSGNKNNSAGIPPENALKEKKENIREDNINNNNPPQGASADTREKMLVDTFAPILADVNVRLKSSGHKEIDATLMLKELARFKDEYSKNSIAYPENWYLGRFSSWIMTNHPSRQPGNKSSKNNQPRPSQQPNRNVNDAWPDIPEHAPAVDNTELPEDFV